MLNDAVINDDEAMNAVCEYARSVSKFTVRELLAGSGLLKNAAWLRLNRLLEAGDVHQLPEKGWKGAALYAWNHSSLRPTTRRHSLREQQRRAAIKECKENWQGLHIHRVIGSGGAYKLHGVL